eukprot:g32240.t1
MLVSVVALCRHLTTVDASTEWNLQALLHEQQDQTRHETLPEASKQKIPPCFLRHWTLCDMNLSVCSVFTRSGRPRQRDLGVWPHGEPQAQ